MQSTCDRAIRCLCSCLIRKQTLKFAEINEEHKTFMTSQNQDQHAGGIVVNKEDTLQDKISDYLGQNRTDRLEEVEGTRATYRQVKSEYSKIGQQEQNVLHVEKQQNIKDYRDVISPQHPFYNLFQSKLQILGRIFQVPPNALHANPQTSYPLNLNCYQEDKVNIFTYSFTFPTTADTYQSISNDFDLQTKLDNNIEIYRKQHQVVGGDTKLLYLCYKRIFMMSGRDFYYVKYSFKKDNQHWSICVSDLGRQAEKDKVRGEFILTATRIVEVEGGIEVNVYSKIDMKLPIKPEMAKNRGFAQIRKYLDKVLAHIKTIQNDIL